MDVFYYFIILLSLFYYLTNSSRDNIMGFYNQTQHQEQVQVQVSFLIQDQGLNILVFN